LEEAEKIIVDLTLPSEREDQKFKQIKFSPASLEKNFLKKTGVILQAVFEKENLEKTSHFGFEMDITRIENDIGRKLDPLSVKITQDSQILEEFLTMEPFQLSSRDFCCLNEEIDKIVGNTKRPFSKLEKWYQWLAWNVAFNVSKNPCACGSCSIKEVFREHSANCNRLNLVFVLGARLLGIPSRITNGYFISHFALGVDHEIAHDKADQNIHISRRNSAPGNHNWSEVHLDPYGWIPMDFYQRLTPAGLKRGLLNPNFEKKFLEDFKKCFAQLFWVLRRAASPLPK